MTIRKTDAIMVRTNRRVLLFNPNAPMTVHPVFLLQGSSWIVDDFPIAPRRFFMEQAPDVGPGIITIDDVDYYVQTIEV